MPVNGQPCIAQDCIVIIRVDHAASCSCTCVVSEHVRHRCPTLPRRLLERGLQPTRIPGAGNRRHGGHRAHVACHMEIRHIRTRVEWSRAAGHLLAAQLSSPNSRPANKARPRRILCCAMPRLDMLRILGAKATLWSTVSASSSHRCRMQRARELTKDFLDSTFC